MTRVSGGAAAGATNGGSSSVERCSVGGPRCGSTPGWCRRRQEPAVQSTPPPRDAHNGRVLRCRYPGEQRSSRIPQHAVAAKPLEGVSGGNTQHLPSERQPTQAKA